MVQPGQQHRTTVVITLEARPARRNSSAVSYSVLGRARGLPAALLGLGCRPSGGGGFKTGARRLRLQFCRRRTPAVIPPTTTLPMVLPMN